MKTALITTVFNEIKNIDRFLSSLVNQTEKPDSIVIVDGGSTDGTFERMQEYKILYDEKCMNLTLIRQSCNISKGRNIAINNTDADIICVTDAGVILDQDWFKQISLPLLENPDLDYVGGNFDIGGEKKIQQAFRILGYRNKASNAPSSRSFAFRRKCWQVYAYPENLNIHEDTKLCNEWRVLGFRSSYLPKAKAIWIAENTIPKLYKKYSRYTEWWIRSGDHLDLLRIIQIITYTSALVILPYSIIFAMLIISASIGLRITRQCLRTNEKFTNFEKLRLLPWLVSVQLTLDAAVLGGSVKGFYYQICKETDASI